MKLDEAMDYEFEQFGTSEDKSLQLKVQRGMNRTVTFVLYGVLVVLLLILVMVTGIKFTQLNQDLSGVKSQLDQIFKPAASEASEQQDVFFKKLYPDRGSCQERWASFQQSCYLLSSEAVTWNKAAEQCRTHGGHLLVLNSVEELDYISKIVELRYNYWIGLVEHEHEGHWGWVDGTDIQSTPLFWDVGQPDDWDYRVNGEDCGQLHASLRRKRKLWNDADCTLPYQYICETKA